MNKALSIIFFCLNLMLAKSQMPNTDLWLLKIEGSKEGLKLTHPVNITNRQGYDNQPAFSNDSKKIMYVSVRDDKQADIYCYELKSKKITPFTKTPISEYSPVITGDDTFITSVTVESDSTQYIHFIGVNTGVHEKKIEVDSVGYYTFLNTDTVAYYKLTVPHSLRYHVMSTGEDKWLGNSPIRTFKAVSRNTLIYGLKDSTKVVFYKYNFLLHKAEKYCDYPSINEDICWHKALGLIKSEGTKLLRFDEQKKEWVMLFDLAGFGIRKITRFDFDPKNKYLVVVDNL